MNQWCSLNDLSDVNLIYVDTGGECVVYLTVENCILV